MEGDMGSEVRVRRSLFWWLPLVIMLAVGVHAQAQGLPAIVAGFGLPDAQQNLDLKLKNEDLWVGSVGGVIDFPSGLALAIKGQAAAKKNVTIYEGEEFVYLGERGVVWTGTGLEWWTIDGQVLYRLRNGCSVLAGLRRDHLAVNLDDPRDSYGNPLNFDISFQQVIPLQPFSIVTTFHAVQSCDSDLMSKLWIPYVGLEITGPRYKASFIGSPFAWAEMKIPASLLFYLGITGGTIPPYLPPLVVELVAAEGVRYRIAKPAIFLEANFQYDCNVAQPLTLRLWCNASWMQCRGRGTWNRDDWVTLFTNHIPFPPNVESYEQANMATYTRRILGGGVAAILTF
jgi:hypothetical protein